MIHQIFTKNGLGRVRFCALILDFDENRFFNINLRDIHVKYGIICEKS